ncbi:MAG: hypothetical protein ACREFQ_10295 [Stellaceae bacterium]
MAGSAVDSPRAIPSPSNSAGSLTDRNWFSEHAAWAELKSLGFRAQPGGAHLARTMMLVELGLVLNTNPYPGRDDVGSLVLLQNILQKRTGSGRRLSLRHLRELYGFGETPPPILRAMMALWVRAGEGQPVLAILAALAREVLLRDSAEIILAVSLGAPVRTPELAALFECRYPGRYTPKMVRSLSQNCASSWTQSGHLRGKVRKERSRPSVSPETAAYAALLGSLAGFGGPALLGCPWVAVLDRSEGEVLALLRKAEAEGLLRLRAGGDVIEIEARRHMAAALGVPELADH